MKKNLFHLFILRNIYIVYLKLHINVMHISLVILHIIRLQKKSYSEF